MSAVGWHAPDVDSGTDSPSTAASGTEDANPVSNFFGGIVGGAGAAVVWTPSWTPVVADASPGLAYDQTNNQRVVITTAFPVGRGTLILTATVGGVPADGALRMVFNASPDLYAPMAYDVIGSGPAADFWTQFVQTYETP